MVTCGDIGTPASELRRRFPELDAQLAALPELWWHAAAHPAADKTNCALRKRFGSHENKQQLMVGRPGAGAPRELQVARRGCCRGC